MTPVQVNQQAAAIVVGDDPKDVVVNYTTQAIELLSNVVEFTGSAGGDTGVVNRAALATIVATNRDICWLAETGRQGMFQFDSSDLSALVAVDTQQAVFVAPASDPTGASGAWVRQFDRTLLPGWFGMVADDEDGLTGTDNSVAFTAMQRLIEALSITSLGAGYGGNPLAYRGAPYELLIVGAFYVGTATLDFLTTAKVRGLGGIGPQAPSRLRFAEDTTGYRAQSYNTSGASTVDGVEHFAGDCQVIEDIFFFGAYDGATPNEGEFHGAHLKRPAFLRRCTFYNFQGDGLHEDTSAAAGGNTDLIRVDNCQFLANRNGRWAKGGDSNASLYINNSYRFNRVWGIRADNFLISNEISPHIDGNGIVVGMPAYTQCAVGTHRYAVVDGQEPWAMANAPTGGTTDNTGWYYLGEGGELAGVVPTWTAGLTFRSGGPICTTNVNNAMNIVGPYVESGQGPCQLSYPTYVDNAGGLSSGVKGYGVTPYNYQGWWCVGSNGRGIMVEGASTFNSTNITLDGNAAGGAAHFDFDAPGGQENGLHFKEAGVEYGYILRIGSSMYVNASNTFNFRIGNVQLANFEGGIFRLASGTELWANGFKIIDGSGIVDGNMVSPFDATNDGAVPASGGGTVNFLRADGTWAAPAGGGGGGSSWSKEWGPLVNEAPSSNFATIDTRNGHAVLDFDAATAESAIFTGVLPNDYSGGGITVTLYWAATSATSGNVMWQASLERIDAGTLDIDADSFATAQAFAAAAANASSGVITKTSLNISDGANMDGLAAGDLFRLKITRDAANASDTMSGDAELLRVMMVPQ